MTKEKAVFILFKHRWMNVIAMFKENQAPRKDGICYYVNIASPTILDQGYLKYIDYDLDVKLYPDGVERTLDENEFARHAEIYGYSPDLLKVIKESEKTVREMIAEGKFPFIDEEIEKLFHRFLEENKPFVEKKHIE